jgi:hypothetical protein
MRRTWNADILRHDKIKMDGVTWNLECEESLDVAVNLDCCKRCREVQIACNGSTEGETGWAGEWTNWGYYCLCGNKTKMIRREQEFVNHKIVLAVKTVCSNPNGARVAGRMNELRLLLSMWKQDENDHVGTRICKLQNRISSEDGLQQS